MVTSPAGIDQKVLPLTDAKSVAKKRQTYIPLGFQQEGNPEIGGDLENPSARLKQLYTNAPDYVLDPSYDRYGMSTLQWTSYGASCGGVEHYLAGGENAFFTIGIKLPVTISMAVLGWALDPTIGKVASSIVSPVTDALTNVAAPYWMGIIFCSGVAIFIKTRSSMQLIKYMIWVFTMIGSIGFLTTYSGGKAMDAVSGVVVKGVSSISCNFDTADGKSCSHDNGLGQIDNQIWRGLVYHPWAAGEVGDDEADAASVSDGSSITWAAAMANAMYVNHNDNSGKALGKSLARWNTGDYAAASDSDGGGNKAFLWKGSGAHQWSSIPFLGNVKILCADPGVQGQDPGDIGNMKFLREGNCDSDTAGTSNIVSAVTGQNIGSRVSTLVMGSVGAIVFTVASAGIAAYITIQRFLLVYLLMFSALFLTIAMVGSKKHQRFARKYGELLFANVLKQAAAVAFLLLFLRLTTNILAPQNEIVKDAISAVPLNLRPMLLVVAFAAMAALVIPFARLAKAAASGDTTLVNKTADAPKQIAKFAGKAVGTAAVSAATGGLGAAAAKAGTASRASSLVSAGAGTGRGLSGLAAMAAKPANPGAKSTGLAGKTATALRGFSPDGETLGGGIAAVGQMLGGKTGHRVAQLGAKTAAAEMRTRRAMAAQTAETAAQRDAVEGGEAVIQAVAASPWGRKNVERDGNGKLTESGRRTAAQKALHLSEEHEMNLRNNKYIAPIANAYKRVHGHAIDADRAQDGGVQVPLTGAPGAPGTGLNGLGPVDGGDAPTSAPGTPGTPLSGTKFGKTAATQGLPVTPGGPRNPDIVTTVVNTGAELLQNSDMSIEEVAANPASAVAGTAYSASPSRMDPAHPATPALTNLAFAVDLGTPDEYEEACAFAGGVIAEHGIPDEISAIHSTGVTAANFTPDRLLAATIHPSETLSWEDKAAAAYEFSAAAAEVPEDHPAADAVTWYKGLINDPGADPADLAVAREFIYDAVHPGSSLMINEEYRAAYEPAPRDVAQAEMFPPRGVRPDGRLGVSRTQPAPDAAEPGAQNARPGSDADPIVDATWGPSSGVENGAPSAPEHRASLRDRTPPLHSNPSEAPARREVADPFAPQRKDRAPGHHRDGSGDANTTTEDDANTVAPVTNPMQPGKLHRNEERVDDDLFGGSEGDEDDTE
ncbi:hypothetical protein [Branchiibius cervicis]|uniref:TrbL/VirB6 plasmid conjugal transfer protein n=1 Tax=Branchiibius cervicis TaxID=908252 RepID=A0ABW2AVQ3_9MICO